MLMIAAVITYIAIGLVLIFVMCKSAARGDAMADEAHFAETGKRLFDQLENEARDTRASREK